MGREENIWKSYAARLALVCVLSAALLLAVHKSAGGRLDGPLYSGIEAAGALLSLLMAVILFQRKSPESGGRSFLFSLGFAALGIFGSFHSASIPENQFVLLHAMAGLCGGFFFGLIWFPDLGAYLARRRYLIWYFSALALSACSLTFIYYSSVPVMISGGEFTGLTVSLNLLGGIFFLLAAARLFRDLHPSDNEGYLLTGLTVILGLSCFLFVYPAPRDPERLLWHIPRLAVCLLLLKTMLAAYRGSEDKYRGIFESFPDLYYQADLSGRVLMVSPSVERLSGWTAEEAMGKNVRELYADPAERAGLMAELESKGLVMGYEITLKKKDGTRIPVMLSARLKLDEQGCPVAVEGTLRDMSEIKRTREELKKAKEAAEAANVAKSRFLANMSHEIRTPMNAIIGMTGLLIATPLDPEQRDYVRTVSGAGEALLDIINDMLDLSRIESDKLVLEKVDFDLRHILGAMLKLLAPRAQAKGLELTYFVEDDVPACLRGDRKRLRQVLLNLVGNAVKFTETGEVVLRVSKESGAAGGTVLKFSVKDTGIGIAPGTQKDLFQAFTQADASTTRKYGGTGLGLSISKQLVELMGGAIGLESEPGRGSSFWFTLPFENTSGPPAAEPAGGEDSNIRALVVDDNAVNREIICRYLGTWRMRFESAASGEAALRSLIREAAGEDPFRLVIFDMQMPEMDGLMLVRAIQANPAIAGIKKVMMTSSGDFLSAKEIAAEGISVCLTKPVQPSALFDALNSAISGARAKAPPEAAPPAPEEARPANKYFKVLIAEDNAVNQMVELKQLAKLGYRADVAADGLEVIAALKRGPYDLVLMDCQMPNMDGFQATAEILKMEEGRRHTPIIAMTANAMRGDRERCLAAGMDGYISKPVRLEQLAEVLAQWDTPLDAAAIKYLRELAGPESPGFISDLLGIYLEDLPGRLEAVKSAVRDGNAEGLRQAAHGLKGSSGNIGAMRLQKICLLLESIAGSGTVEGAAEPLEILEKEAANTAAAMEALRRGGI